VFCRLNNDLRSPIHTTPNVIRIVGNGKEPVPLSDSEISSLRLLHYSMCPTLPATYITSGDKVRVLSGNLAGVEGYVIQLRGNQRIVISVSSIMSALSVELDLANVSLRNLSTPSGQYDSTRSEVSEYSELRSACDKHTPRISSSLHRSH